MIKCAGLQMQNPLLGVVAFDAWVRIPTLFSRELDGQRV